MNANQLINMIIRMATQRLVNKGINIAAKKMGGEKGPQATQNLRKLHHMARRTGRF